MTIAYEVNFDGLVGLTHFYGGLSPGNVASMENKGQISNPQQAALQGLNKMRLLASLGVKQAVLPPHERPHLPSLKRLGFEGTDEAIFAEVRSQAAWLLPQVSSSASMWTANIATVSPSIDSSDSHVHFTPANLATNFHRAIEAETTSRILKAIFRNSVFFAHHSPLLAGELFFDEGAANHARFCRNYQGPGIQLFVFGEAKQSLDTATPQPDNFPARQTREASVAIARLHKLYPGHTVFAFQNPEAIDAGVFHNDVICLSNQNLLLVHEKAFWNQDLVLQDLKNKVASVCDTDLNIIEIKESQISLEEAVQSYLFNSQIVSLPDGSMALIAPTQCQQFESIVSFFKQLTESNDNPLQTIHFVDLNESMQNGGGPACLRLRIVLNEKELSEINPAILFNERLYQRLVEHVMKFYPTSLTLNDLYDPRLYQLNCKALTDLTQILELGKVYDFQF